jgi:hypothetical protein
MICLALYSSVRICNQKSNPLTWQNPVLEKNRIVIDDESSVENQLFRLRIQQTEQELSVALKKHS